MSDLKGWVGEGHQELPKTTEVPHPPVRGTALGRFLIPAFLRLRARSHVHGALLVPPTGPVILASNHMGLMDGPVLFAVAPRRIHALVKHKMFQGRLGWLLLRAGQIPVQRHEVDPGAVKACLRVLRDGGTIAIYPEGTRGTGAVDHAHGGAAYLALVTGAPIVPVAVLGTRPDGGRQGAMPTKGARIDTVFGAPFSYPAEPWPRTRARVDVVRREVQERLAAHVAAACELTGQTLPALWPEETES